MMKKNVLKTDLDQAEIYVDSVRKSLVRKKQSVNLENAFQIHALSQGFIQIALPLWSSNP